MLLKWPPSRRFLAPEVIQASMMDCGPATIKCVLEGFRIPISYGRLREACQTDIDGSSIDTLEAVTTQLGLDAEQLMLPADSLFLTESHAFPAIVVTRLPNGSTHFIVAWRVQGNLVQVMNPATGRQWLTRQRFLDDLYIHRMPVLAADWRAYADSNEFLKPLQERLGNLSISDSTIQRLIQAARSEASWQGFATLDAATRLVTSIVESRGLQAGAQAAHAVETFYQEVHTQADDQFQVIPKNYWSVRPYASNENGEAQLLLQGALLIRIRGVQQNNTSDTAMRPILPTEINAALAEPTFNLLSQIFHFLRQDGLLNIGILASTMGLTALSTIFTAILFRGLLDIGHFFNLPEQRLAAAAGLLIFLAVQFSLKLVGIAGIQRLGRHLELRLRVAFLEKLPRLGSRYFRSRLISDMALRTHLAYILRELPTTGGRLIHAATELLFTCIGLFWLNPSDMGVIIGAGAMTVIVPFITNRIVAEHDGRIQVYTASIARFFMDGMLGLTTLRAHGGSRALRREQADMIGKLTLAFLRMYTFIISLTGIQLLLSYGFAAWLILSSLAHNGTAGGLLLTVYWALSLPDIGQRLIFLAYDYSHYRTTHIRIVEPLGAPDEEPTSASAIAHPTEEKISTLPGVAITMQDVCVQAAGHIILENINFDIKPGSHVAIIGVSGAGKSSLVGLLLGWHQPTSGVILIDDQSLDGSMLRRLRQNTAWVDPAVYIWNRSLLDNLLYGIAVKQTKPVHLIIEQADLRAILKKLPNGLQTELGEGGGLVSGGEGQRVRLGRAMLRPDVRLVILDEPFRGLDHHQRHDLLRRARQLWKDATLLCITHDVSETQHFERVLVVEDGHILEDGIPRELAVQPTSRYRAFLEAEQTLHQDLWSSEEWHRLRMDDGYLER